MKREIKDYSKYTFREDEVLEVEPMFLENIHKMLDLIINKEGVGSHYLTAPRFDNVNRETSKVVKKVTKANSDKVDSIFSVPKTIQAEAVQHLTPLGKQALAMMMMVQDVRIDNLDKGKGDLIETIRKEMEEHELVMEELPNE